MAIQVIDGFDLYNGVGANTGVQAKWINNGTFSMVAGRFGGQAFRIGTGASNSGSQRIWPSNYAEFTVGIAVRYYVFPTVTNSAGHIIFMDSTSTQCGITVNTSGAVEIRRFTTLTTSTTLATSANSVISANTWHYIEMETVINDTTGSMNVYVDGVLAVSVSGADTKTSANNYANRISIGNSQGNTAAAGSIDFDDYYLTDSATRLGERRVETLMPNADTAQKDFTRSAGSDNFALVDEALSNGDTDYVQGSTVGNLDRYTHAGFSVPPTAISAVQLTSFALKTDANSRSIALHARSGATDSDGPNYALAASYGKFDRILETDPATSTAWTPTGVNSLQFGPKVTV